MRESASAKAARLQHAMKCLSQMPDGAEPWAITAIAASVAEGLTFEEAVAEEERDWAERHPASRAEAER